MLPQGLALEELGHCVRDIALGGEVEDLEDVGMRERGDGLCFALESSNTFVILSH